jgi:hypothetical protein
MASWIALTRKANRTATWIFSSGPATETVALNTAIEIAFVGR